MYRTAVARATRALRALVSTREVAGATRRLPGNPRFSLESADRREADDAGEA
ncbi:hypothetical protein [Halorubrum ezzemoulense]|uniref:hypothetical protein n=1 Tax=Halorubrum ezzemoulense TaxID=337243 RepID=UPI0015C5B152|nr:hypothetical protein [Halorubrum ezzemoulense]MDB2224718.1 hypothetical protein [Halorubrum ezzemoulense]MDB2275082.1 hypothetical protein [Halorubrum ezzemoulense]